MFQYPIQTFGYAFLFSLSGYLGMQFVLTLVRTCGAPLAATVTTARKAVTITISFLLFNKPFSMGYNISIQMKAELILTVYTYCFRYLFAGLIVVSGIYLNVYSKRNKLTFADCWAFLRRLSPSISYSGASRKPLLEV